MENNVANDVGNRQASHQDASQASRKAPGEAIDEAVLMLAQWAHRWIDDTAATYGPVVEEFEKRWGPILESVHKDGFNGAGLAFAISSLVSHWVPASDEQTKVADQGGVEHAARCEPAQSRPVRATPPTAEKE